MKHGTQTKIAKLANISEPALSQYINGRRRPSWTTAKIIAKITKTKTELWMDGTPEEIKQKLSQRKFTKQ
jgi:transcriptional regulator with XRE-family HTH domain